ncbi:GNAT family N-acetyltransferase [Sporolactobacillus kofuensis]|uniref:GNAT family N-acetyltransferase n=1 Tax=Sporolactobacillus kofuensis TaxID=269672 RepID=A0ABW1WDD0_9BACL|nr:GNAT family N-acetyltransferase [Sporolactobacillus kofuensis]MCO7175060.1 GNAT family N-acetyltransferase [Sporolactobacillus kofuensis]
MIRQLTEKDRNQILAFAGDRPAENLFIIGDIEAFGIEDDALTLWGDFDSQGDLLSILLRYMGNFIPYAQDPDALDGQSWAKVIQESGQLGRLSGLQSLVEKIVPHIQLPIVKKQTCQYAKRDLQLPIDNQEKLTDVKMLFPEEAEKVIQLRNSRFTSYAESPETLQKNMNKGISRTYYIERNNELVSSVSTAAETRRAAMIVGVCTKKDYEHQGYATSCLIKTIRALRAEHKQPCLFYDNPKAGRIYERLGFLPIETWMMVTY